MQNVKEFLREQVRYATMFGKQMGHAITRSFKLEEIENVLRYVEELERNAVVWHTNDEKPENSGMYLTTELTPMIVDIHGNPSSYVYETNVSMFNGKHWSSEIVAWAEMPAAYYCEDKKEKI